MGERGREGGREGERVGERGREGGREGGRRRRRGEGMSSENTYMSYTGKHTYQAKCQRLHLSGHSLRDTPQNTSSCTPFLHTMT